MMGLIPPIIYFRSVAKTLEISCKNYGFYEAVGAKVRCFTHLATSASETAMFETVLTDLSPNIFCTLTALLGDYIAMYLDSFVSYCIIYITHPRQNRLTIFSCRTLQQLRH
jgi:hypothetical protein